MSLFVTSTIINNQRISNFLDTFPSILVVAGGSEPEFLLGNSTLAHAEILTSGSSAACHFDNVQQAIGETGGDYQLESSAHVEGGSGNTV
jgi:hypothetical protein